MIGIMDFKEIVVRRNEGKSQEEIAKELGVSRRTVGKYLRSGEVPSYGRKFSTRIDPFIDYQQQAQALIESKPDIDMKEVLERLQANGYKGSYRTLCRKTKFVRQKAKHEPVYFERAKLPGYVMEGDFTELAGVSIGGSLSKIHLWVVTLAYSNKIFATGFFRETFECFAQGSQEAFMEFGGLAHVYRLDNLSPVVSKILKNQRETTSRFNSFQKHFGFKTHFCNPASGWEKGSVESTNLHLKKRLTTEMALSHLSFTSLQAFNEFVQSTCRKLNQREDVAMKFAQEGLCPLPACSFEAYGTYMSKVSKYSTISYAKEGHRYSVPSEYIGCQLEVRGYANRIKVVSGSEVVAEHERLCGARNKVSIQIEHVIKGLCRKPGALVEWKHKQVLFEHPVWDAFYERMKQERNEQSSIKEFLKCVALITSYGRQNVTVGMELLAQQQGLLTSEKLERVITNQDFDPMSIKPTHRNLVEYDELLSRRSL